MIRPVVLAAALLASACTSTPDGGADTVGVVGEPSDPRNRAKLHTELAALYYGNGNFAVALEELRIATRADANYAPTHGMYGLVYMQLRENDRAESSFERALQLAPSDPDINHNYGWFLCQTGREPASVKYFLDAIRNPLYTTQLRSY